MRPRRVNGNTIKVALASHIILANVNHLAHAQDLLTQTMADRKISLAVFAEAYCVRNRPYWPGDELRAVAITRRISAGTPPLRTLTKGPDFIATVWGKVTVVVLYDLPGSSLESFTRLQDELSIYLA